MEKGMSFDTESIARAIGTEKIEELEIYSNDVMDREFSDFHNIEDILTCFENQIPEYQQSLTLLEYDTLKEYTGYNFRMINNIMRYKWDYNQMGERTQEKEKRFRDTGERLEKVIHKFPKLESNIKVYRGVNIRAFYDYGITQLEDLPILQGKFMYEPGFSSTSLLRSNSFFEKKLEYGDYCNIEIEILVPEESQDGAPLLTDAVSYSKNQFEYVINCNSLFKVTSVQLDINNNRAFLKAILIPKILWDPVAVQILDEETQQVKK